MNFCSFSKRKYCYGTRTTDPELGRFISADTIVQAPYDPQSFNRYSYCRNNPLNYVDPTGHFWAELIWTIIVIAAGWGLAQTGMAEVNVGGGVSIPFDTGPSSHPSYSSSNPAPSSPQTNYQNVNSSSSSGDNQSFDSGESSPADYNPVKSVNSETSDNNVSLWNRSLSSLWAEFQEELTHPQPLDKQQIFSLVVGFSGGLKFVGGRETVAQIAKRIVIGEGSGRVAEKALAIDAEHYVSRYRLPKNPTLAQIGRVMKSNYQWLKYKVERGYEIIDIGLDPKRVGGRGWFYAAEKRWLKLWGE